MQAIEFQTFLGKDRIIKVPEDFSEKFNGGKVRVIVLAEEKPVEEKSYLRELIENPVSIPNFKPMPRDEIYERGSK